MRLRLMGLVALFVLATTAFAAGPIRITVDATDAPRDVLHAHLTIPASAGPLTLYYPKWIPGEHGPTGPIAQVAGVHITANHQPVTWSRDPVEMYAMHVDVPSGATAVDVDLDYLNPVGNGAFSGGGSMTPRLAVISWNDVLLYPAANSSDALQYEPTLRLPAGWKYATALTTTSTNGNDIQFEPVTLTRLIDSPVLAGAYLNKVNLPAATSTLRHTINLASDSEAAIVTPPNFAADYARLVDEAHALFGAEHYRHYDWLVTLSDNVQHFGLEHHESSDDRTNENALEDERGRRGLAGLLSHEYMHSWNGKYRRPAGLAVSNYDRPMQGELLWVYEGLTTYLGDLLATRSGMWTDEYYRESLASIASRYSSNAGRSWRPLADTAVEAQILYGAPRAWAAYRRGTDFYEEGLLLWLDTDMTIRKLTGDKKSLNDFCRLFYGGPDGDPTVHPYTFDDVVHALNQVAPNDWASFLNQRLHSTTAAPLGGIETSGWRLVFNDKPNAAEAPRPGDRTAGGNYSAMLGFWVGGDGRVADVIPGSPAAKAGIVPGAMLIAVNGSRYSGERLKAAVKESSNTTTPIQLIYSSGEFVNTANVDYHGGLRYPHLEKIASSPDWLAELVKPLAKK
jgi:predicted metalloprotease with PDZ domain